MRTVAKLTVLIISLSISLSWGSVLNLAQTCSSIAQEAIETTSQACSDTLRNQACYGHSDLEVMVRSGFDDAISFEKSGDKLDISAIQRLTLSPINETRDEWGIILMQVQANLPVGLPGQNVTLLLFGDVEIDNMGEVLPTVPVIANRATSIYDSPSDDGTLITTLTDNQDVMAFARDEGGDWLQIETADGLIGWVRSADVDAPADIVSLHIATDDAPVFRPMQAFVFRSGVGAAACEEVEDVLASGLLIQTPEGVGKIDFLVNGVNIALGSTVFMQAEASENLVIYTIEGEAEVRLDDTVQVVKAGMLLHVPMNDLLLPDGLLDAPEGFNRDDLQSLPLDLLPLPLIASSQVDSPPDDTDEPDEVPPLQSATIIVDGNADWVDTGIDVLAGQTLVLSASGTVNVWVGCAEDIIEQNIEGFDCDSIIYGPEGGLARVDGSSRIPNNAGGFPLPNEAFHALIGRIGDNTPFMIGSGITLMPDVDGRLYLRVNDVDYNNSGAFTVIVSVD